jgi:hypothetical protein
MIEVTNRVEEMFIFCLMTSSALRAILLVVESLETSMGCSTSLKLDTTIRDNL